MNHGISTNKLNWWKLDFWTISSFPGLTYVSWSVTYFSPAVQGFLPRNGLREAHRGYGHLVTSVRLEVKRKGMNFLIPRWWFRIFFMFTPTWGNDPIWLYNIFQLGWSHQLVTNLGITSTKKVIFGLQKKTTSLLEGEFTGTWDFRRTSALFVWNAKIAKSVSWRLQPCSTVPGAYHKHWLFALI